MPFPLVALFLVMFSDFTTSSVMCTAASDGFPWLLPGDFHIPPSGTLYLNVASKSPLPIAVEAAGKDAVSAQVQGMLR